MNKIYIIGIGFRPLDKIASGHVCTSDVVLANDRLVDVFKGYAEYDIVRDKITVHASVFDMLDYMDAHYRSEKIALLAAGDPMFFGIGRLVIEKFGKEAAEVYPDLSSIQVAFSRVKEISNNALSISLHGGPDPEHRRKPEYELDELPTLLDRHNKLAILTDRVNNPSIIARAIVEASRQAPRVSSLKMYICEKLGYEDEKITEGMPDEISGRSFSYPNVLIIVKENKDDR